MNGGYHGRLDPPPLKWSDLRYVFDIKKVTHLVVVRYDSLKFADNKIALPGGTKDGLKMLPAFQYSKE